MNIEANLASLARRFLQPVLTRLNLRAEWWWLGRFPVRSWEPVRHVQIQGKDISMAYPEGEWERQQWEVTHLHLDDPYQLRRIQEEVRTVMDVGGNIGFFSLLARQRFPKALVHCYEPNPVLLPALKANTAGLKITVHAEGVGSCKMMGTMRCAGDTLDGVLVPVAVGEQGIPIIPLAEAVERMGGSLDLLKLDCEGAEWDIFQDLSTLAKVRMLTMEYHLDGSPERSLLKLLGLLKGAGFSIEALREAQNPLVGQLFAVRRT